MSKATKTQQKVTLDILLPVYNEQEDLPVNVPVLHNFAKQYLKKYDWQILIVDNGPSKDKTPEVGRELARKLAGVTYIQIPRPGRGNALKEVWLKSKAEILAYMDIDLSSDLKYFPKLVATLENGADIAIGSRLKPGAKVYGRTLLREIMSRGYNVLIKIFFWTGFHDAQCGFKGMSRTAAQAILPNVIDRGWFFDTEVLIIGEKAGFKIAELPIVWRDDPNSTVKVAKTAWGDIQGLYRLFITRPWNKLEK
jgi:glycosyltransferase involved in cell wall biosynthesis